MSRSPYRTSGRTKSARRRLSFFHARFTVAVVGALILLAIGVGCSTPPRTVRLECEPNVNPGLFCESSARSIWGVTSRTLTTAISADGVGPHSIILDLEYQRPRRGETWARVSVRFGSGATAAVVTDAHPVRSAGALRYELSNFEDSLRAGRRATLSYQTGWGGWTIAVPLALLALLVLWLGSGRTVIVFDPDAGRVETHSEPLWLLRTHRRDLGWDDVAEVVVDAAQAGSGATLYRPAFRLKSAEIVALGQSGLTTPERAQHFAAQLGQLLELPVELSKR